MTDYSRKIVVRTSPSELNGELESYNPMPMFRNGVQIIALNIQKEDKNFQDNIAALHQKLNVAKVELIKDIIK